VYDIKGNYNNTVQAFAIGKLFTLFLLISVVLYVPSSLHVPIFQSAYYIGNIFGQEQLQQPNFNSCITYDPEEKIITITCKFATLTDIDNKLKDPEILHRETYNNIWLLNAAIVIDKGATLNIDSKDTKWLKIIPREEEDVKRAETKGEKNAAYSISVLGSLKIDSVKISSWDPKTNDYIKFKFDTLPSREYEKSGIDAVPRPYIVVEEEATGRTDITNSELAYLGHDCAGGCSGLTYYGGERSMVKGNEIHHNRFGFYSKAVGGLILEDNHVHHNFMYGFDPHTGTHDMVIRNNTVHDHGAMGIICSVDCYNVTIDGNEVYKSAGSGIMFSRNMYDSVARNNNVYNEEVCVFVSQSHNNKVHDNTISNCETGIKIFHDSADNTIFSNTITDSILGLNIEDAGSGNQVYSNAIINATEKLVNIEDSNMMSEEDILSNNTIENP
jgi:mannuronan 5-epimerase